MIRGNMARPRFQYLSPAEVDHLDDKQFIEYLVDLLKESNHSEKANRQARKIWSAMTPEQRNITLKYMGVVATPQGQT